MIPFHETDQIRDDLRERIRWYRVEQGAPETVVDAFLMAFDEAIDTLRAWPDAGRSLENRPDLQVLNLPKPFERHLLVFRHTDGRLHLLRLVGAEQDRARFGR